MRTIPSYLLLASATLTLGALGFVGYAPTAEAGNCVVNVFGSVCYGSCEVNAYYAYCGSSGWCDVNVGGSCNGTCWVNVFATCTQSGACPANVVASCAILYSILA